MAMIERFTIQCERCGGRVGALPEWIGREVQCPHCFATIVVPGQTSDALPAVAPLSAPSVRRAFNFSCGRCAASLEADTTQSGRVASCPTCGARFEVPNLDPRTGQPQPARLFDTDQQDPTPMHAYAASGHLAPRIHRTGEDSLTIECPRCAHENAVDAIRCAACGVPFTVEGALPPSAPPGSGYGRASLILGIVSLPLHLLAIPAILAIVFGAAALAKRNRPGATERAGISLAGVAGILLGALSLLLLFLTTL